MSMFKLFPAEEGEEIRLNEADGIPEQVHVFDEESIIAVNTALAAKRPLLVRGEPGTGKTQLARAVAKKLERVFIPYVVDARTEPRDLLWRFDAVARLAEAQLQSSLPNRSEKQMRKDLKISRFIVPGPLWWAFSWKNALEQAEGNGPAQLDGGNPDEGSVILIDEIDKAESDVPNALLQALGDCCFLPEGFENPVQSVGMPSLVVITTNEERSLPDAFVRRCCVLWLDLPKKMEPFIECMVLRGRAHFGDGMDTILEESAKLIWKQRSGIPAGHPRPGQAEFMDLVRAVASLDGDAKTQLQTLTRISRFVLKKHDEVIG